MHVNTGNMAGATPFALGLGCERGTSAGEVIRLGEQALIAAGIDRHALACVASLDARAAEPAMLAAAAHFSVPFRVFDAATLDAETARLKNPSEIVFALTGCHGVAEAAALAATGKASTLVVPKIKSANATAAVAGSGFVESIEGVADACHQTESTSSRFDSALSSPETEAAR